MLFRDETKSLVVQSLDAAREAVDQERSKIAFLYEDYLASDQVLHMSKLTGAAGVKYDELAKLVHPFADRIISEFSLAYKKPPQRYFDSAKPTSKDKGVWKHSKHDEEVARWHELAEQDESDYNPTFIATDKRTRMHGRTIVRCWPAFDLGSREHKKGLNYPRFDIFHPGQFDVVVDSRYPTRPLSYILWLQTADSGAGDNIAQVWTADEVVEVVNGKRGVSIPNKLGFLPFVGFANYIDPQEYWRAGMGRKICLQNAIFDLGWTHCMGMMINQAHGQPVAKNPDTKWSKAPQWGWDKLVKLEEDGEFTFAQSGAQIDSMIAGLQKILENTYFSCGLPTNRFRDGYVPASGLAYRLENSTVLEDREERVALFSPRDRMCWRMAFRVAAAFSITTLPEPKEIVVSYADPEIPVDTIESTTKRDSDLKANLISVVDEYRKANPDVMGDDEALEELKRNAEYNAEIMGVKAAPTLRDLVAASKAQKQTAPITDEPQYDEEDAEA